MSIVSAIENKIQRGILFTNPEACSPNITIVQISTKDRNNKNALNATNSISLISSKFF